jgi:hypothetical protein
LTDEGVINPWKLLGWSDRGNLKTKEGTVKRNLLKVLMVMALGAIICLPGVAAAGITLTFDDLGVGTAVNTAGDPYSLFTWGGTWTVTASKAVSAGDGATISLAGGGAFNFDGAYFAGNEATSLLITGRKAGANVSATLTLVPSLTSYLESDGSTLFQNFTGITKLTFTGAPFVMDNFTDAATIPLPPSVLLLGSGLLGLVGLGWRRARKES